MLYNIYIEILTWTVAFILFISIFTIFYIASISIVLATLLLGVFTTIVSKLIKTIEHLQ